MTELDEKAVSDRLTRILVEMFEIDPSRLKPQATLRGALRLDSADLLDLVVRIETDFGLPNDLDDDYRSVSTLRELVVLVCNHATRMPDAK
jgi:acyl carrier protein